MKEPIIEFKNNKELRECAKSWQNILYLNDWIISVRLVETNEMSQNNEFGHVDYIPQQKSAEIKIAIFNSYLREAMTKPCHEKTLVHELLHLKYGNVVDDSTYESAYLNVMEHQAIEQMARSLIMAKYGLTPEWFNNVKDD